MNRRHALRALVAGAGLLQWAGQAQHANASAAQAMTMRKIPSSGEMLPVIGLGTWQTFDVGADPLVRKALLDVETHLRTLVDWKCEGRVRYLGVTHYTSGAFDAVAKVISAHRVDFLQINYSVGEREAEQRLLPLARERGVAVIVNRPFAGGDLLRRLRGMPMPAWAAEIDCTSWAQLLLKFVISHPAVTCAIPATARVEHLRDNMAAGLGRLPDERQRAMIAALMS